MKRNKLFTKQELRMTYHRLIQKGMVPDQAYKEVQSMIKWAEENHEIEEKRKKDKEKRYKKGRFKKEWGKITKNKGNI